MTERLTAARGRVAGLHLYDRSEDIRLMRLDRGMMRDGVADLRAILNRLAGAACQAFQMFSRV